MVAAFVWRYHRRVSDVTNGAFPCVYRLYLKVHEHAASVRGSGDARALTSLRVNLDALSGPSRLAGALALLDANSGKAARSRFELCRGVCVETACEAHPHHSNR